MPPVQCNTPNYRAKKYRKLLMHKELIKDIKNDVEDIELQVRKALVKYNEL